MSFVIEFKDKAKADVQKHQKSGQKKLVNKILTFTIECETPDREPENPNV